MVVNDLKDSFQKRFVGCLFSTNIMTPPVDKIKYFKQKIIVPKLFLELG